MIVLFSISEWQMCCNESLTSNRTCDVFSAFSSCKHLLDEEVLEVLVWIVGLSSFVGNACVLVVRSRWFHKLDSRFARVHALMILSLAAADILNGVYLLIIGAANERFDDGYYLHADDWLGSPLCKAAGFIATLSSEMSVLMLTLISIDRLLAVMFPFRVDRRLGIKSTAITITLLWMAAIITCSIPFMFPTSFAGFYGNSDVCIGLPVGLYVYAPPGGGELEIEGSSWKFGIALYVGVNFICIAIIFFCYALIFLVVRRSAKKAQRSQDQYKEVQLAGKMAIIVCTDFVAWFPIVIMFLFVLAHSWSMPTTLYAFIVVFLLPINSALNPFIYTATQAISKLKDRARKYSTTHSTELRKSDKSQNDSHANNGNGVSLQNLTWVSEEKILSQGRSQCTDENRTDNSFRINQYTLSVKRNLSLFQGDTH